jgi:hypothetical protein
MAISALESVQTLMKNNVLVFSGGTRNLGTNNAKEGLRHVQNFVKRNNCTNTVLLCVPYIYDFISWSGINDEIATFNRKLIKSMKCQDRVIVINLDFK